MGEGKINLSALHGVPETMLVPLFFKAKETKENGIIRDDKAVEILSGMQYDFSRMETDWRTQLGMALRTKFLDEILASLLAKTNGKLVVVNLGAGLDTREARFPNIKWYQLDLPESIEIRKKFFPESKSVLIAKSVLDFSWMDDIQEKENVIFIAEGLLGYFMGEEVKAVLQHISSRFSHSFIAFNTIHAMMVGKRPSQSVDPAKAPHKWGIKSIKDVLAWNTGWKLDRVIRIMDYYKKRWRWVRWVPLLIPSFKNGFVLAVLETVS